MISHGYRVPTAAAVVVALAVIVASYVVARTPGDVIGDEIVTPATATAGTEQVDFTLKEGRSAADIGNDLEALGVIRSGQQFELLVSLMGLQDRLSAGEYVLVKGSSIPSVIDAITVKDRVPTLRVTFPEGLRIEEMAALAEKAGFGTSKEFLDAAAQAELPPDLAATVPPGQGLQGYLFPDTYIMPVGSTPAQLVALMIETFDKRFSPALRTAAASHGLNAHQAITLASIVEREAVIEEERPLIAGVFYNRLDNGDMLGADPTVQFAAAQDPASVAKNGWWKKQLTIDDLENPSPYNTRIHPGLPPGPITNPGLASIEAVANPATTKMYYFVADTIKGDGSHVFAQTIEEHLRNVRRMGGQ
jgi:UPF0755 protein